MAMVGQLGRFELGPGRGGGLEGGLAFVDAELVDGQNLIGMSGTHGLDERPWAVPSTLT
ncbi:hypothetical protein [Nonomuraea sp. NPDC049625]|uniref:hypothetical protein n=1 Tax=Nonomuraea sp. NPDC049625 TaxID=3155775 RepID=UPI00343AF94D